MKRLVFIVEGDTEVVFVNNHVIPYLYGLGFSNPMYAQTIITNRKQHAKGGVVSYGKFRNEVVRTLAAGNVLVTTLIDFFKLPTDFPGYTVHASQLNALEQAIWNDLGNNPNFIPYLQKHETEALMFADPIGFELVVDDEDGLKQLRQITHDYPNPEDINNSPQTAPSKRMQRIFKYDKVSDGELIFGEVGIDAMLQKCPRFAEWIRLLQDALAKHA